MPSTRPRAVARWAVVPVLLGVLPGLTPSASAQSEPFTVYDTRPVITEGPYLMATGATSTTIVWMTDTPSHSEVRFAAGRHDTAGALTSRVEPQVDGLVPVGTRHVVHLIGLAPGTEYSYQVQSTRVVKLKAYWPDKGLATTSDVHRFRTLDPGATHVSFAVVTDTHEDVARINRLMKQVDWGATDFLVHTGDAFDWLDTEDQLFRRWLTPITAALSHEKPLVYARGNHELRGPFARELAGYVPTVEGRFYYARDAGPIHLIVLDTGEDKPDDTNVYAHLNRTTPYRNAEYDWLADHVATDAHHAAAPFRVIVMHQPRWGWLAEGPDRWIRLANDAGVDLVIAGHTHRFSYTPPGPGVPHAYHLLVLGQDQVARVEAATDAIHVVVVGGDGAVVREITIPRVRQRSPSR
ncbi:MAG: FN3 domain-containing metallophosphoesterase family protein [Vicinamibacterales bacterium]